MSEQVEAHRRGLLRWVAREQRDRLLLATENAKVGGKYRLAHRAPALLDPKVATRLDPGLRRDDIGKELRARGAPDTCCVFVEMEMTPRVMHLDEALEDLVFWDDAAFISCIPGRLGLFTDEAPGGQWLLIRVD